MIRKEGAPEQSGDASCYRGLFFVTIIGRALKSPDSGMQPMHVIVPESTASGRKTRHSLVIFHDPFDLDDEFPENDHELVANGFLAAALGL